MAEKKAERNNKSINFFLDNEEWSRYLTVFNDVFPKLSKQQQKKGAKTYIQRILLGFDKPDQIVTQKHIDYLYKKISLQKSGIQVIENVSTKATQSDFDFDENEQEKAA